METKANHIVIGAFAIVTIIAAFGFVVWIGQIQLSREYSTYDMYFEGSVSGLSVASDVRYNGISVGTVKAIHQDKDDPNLVLVRVEVEANTPIKEDTVATMAFLGVTGVSFIELTGGTKDSKDLLPRDGAPYGVITVQRSAIQELMETAPNIVAQSNLLLLQGEKLLSDDNIERISRTIEDLNTISSTFAQRERDISELIANASQVSADLSAMTADVRKMVNGTNQMMEGDVPEMIAQITSAAGSINTLASDANSLLDENRASITQFSSQGLNELNTLLAEARQTVETLERLAASIEEDPTVLLGQEQYPEYDAK